MNALSVARAVNSTTLTRPSTAATPITPTAVILNPPFFDPAAPIMSASARLTLSNTPIAFRARYSTEHGSMRLRNSRARRGPRAAAAETAVRALRTASATRPAPRGTVRPRVPVAPTAPVEMGAVGDSTGVTRPAVSRAPAGTAARPVLTLAGGADDGAASGESGGGAIPGARVNFGGLPSPTVARPTTGRPEAALSGDSAPSESAGEVEVPAPGVACVSVMN